MLRPQDQRREQSQYTRIGARTGENVMLEKLALNLRCRAIANKAEQQAHSLDACNRSNDTMLADFGLALAHIRLQIFRLDCLNYGDNCGSCDRATAKG